MKTIVVNPGGQLALEDIVGRGQEIRKYWKVLGTRGLILGAERRLGKTHIVRKMHETGHEGFVTFYQDLEAVHGLTELVRALYRAVDHQLALPAKAKKRVIDFWSTLLPKKLGALELPDARANWKGLLTEAVKDVLDAVEPADKVVFIWDEFPLMLYNLNKNEGTASVIQLLDLLRSLRQQQGARLRFVFTGSIGLHLALRALRIAGHANDATNDMQEETVPPMNEAESQELADRLLRGLDHPPPDVAPLAKALYAQVGGFPYYIHHVVNRLGELDRPANEKDLTEAVDALVHADHDPAHLSYFHERIALYYGPEEARLAPLVLDAIASQADAVSMETLINLARHKVLEVRDDQIRDICLLLRRDHYLTLETREGTKVHGFRWKILQRWWKGSRL